eukprot:35461_1
MTALSNINGCESILLLNKLINLFTSDPNANINDHVVENMNQLNLIDVYPKIDEKKADIKQDVTAQTIPNKQIQYEGVKLFCKAFINALDSTQQNASINKIIQTEIMPQLLNLASKSGVQNICTSFSNISVRHFTKSPIRFILAKATYLLKNINTYNNDILLWALRVVDTIIYAGHSEIQKFTVELNILHILQFVLEMKNDSDEGVILSILDTLIVILNFIDACKEVIFISTISGEKNAMSYIVGCGLLDTVALIQHKYTQVKNGEIVRKCAEILRQWSVDHISSKETVSAQKISKLSNQIDMMQSVNILNSMGVVKVEQMTDNFVFEDMNMKFSDCVFTNCAHFRRLQLQLCNCRHMFSAINQNDGNTDEIKQTNVNPITYSRNNIVDLLNGFNHLLVNHVANFEEIFTVLKNKYNHGKDCDFAKCLPLKRNYRIRSDLSVKQMCSNESEIDDIVMQQIIDKIHCHY